MESQAVFPDLEKQQEGFLIALQPSWWHLTLSRLLALLPAMGCAGATQSTLAPLIMKAVSVALGKYQGWGFSGVVFQQDE